MKFNELVACARTATAVAIMAGFSALHAQVVRGVVRTSIGDVPPLGAVVQLVDSASNEVARTRADDDGKFALRSAVPGRYRLIARDIGYRPAATELFDLRRDTTAIMTLTRLPNVLATVKTVGKSACSIRGDLDSPVWMLWEQITTALLGASVGLGAADEQFQVVESNRRYELNPVHLTAVEFATTTLRGAHPWKSLPPDSLASVGYVAVTKSAATYTAPDLDVLLSRSFLATHCFEIHTKGRASEALVGIDFAPAPGVHHSDIEGTFWLDVASHELSLVTFTYANLSFTSADTLAGGRVSFLRLKTGDWVIPEWVIRAPVISRIAGVDAIVQRANTLDEPVARLAKPTGVDVTRGSLLNVSSSRDSTSRRIWSRATGALRIVVTTDSGPHVNTPLAGAVIRLPQSISQAVSDSDGTAQLVGLVDGEYFVDVAPPWYETLRRAPERVLVSIRDNVQVERRVHVASIDQVIVALCKDQRQSMAQSSGVVSGSVTRNGAREPDALVIAEYTAGGASRVERTVRADKNGAFVICNLPSDVQIHLRAATKDLLDASATAELQVDHRYATSDLELKPHKPQRE